MSWKGRRYEYNLKHIGSAEEINMVGNAYQGAGWIEVGFLPEEGPIKVIIFEWLGDTPPYHPVINSSRR